MYFVLSLQVNHPSRGRELLSGRPTVGDNIDYIDLFLRYDYASISGRESAE